MDIELLIVPDCPHADAAAELVQQALSDLGMTQTSVRTTVVETPEEADRRRFTGSPSILLKGRDLFPPVSKNPRVACRVYMTKNGPRGVPELSALRRALKEAADPATPTCGCCGRTGRRMAELGITPGTYICRTCAFLGVPPSQEARPLKLTHYQLVEPVETPPVVLLHWLAQPSVTIPTTLPAVANAVTTVLAEAARNLRKIEQS